jgi:DNA-binding IclR family transcriptional regulator
MSTLRQAESSGKRITGVGVLDRSVGLLDLLADGPRTLRWLADASGLPRPTAYRLLVALEAHRLVSRDATGAFQLGPRLTELAVRAGPAVDLAALAGPVLARLHEATGESVQLYVRSGDRRLCVAARDAGTGLRDSVAVGALLPLDVGSGGKVLLAWSPDAAHSPAADRAQPDGARSAADAGRSPADWAAELAAVRKRGWAASVAEREPGVASVSAPVLADGQLLGALCVSGPASRIGQAPGKRLAPLVVQAAADLARLAHPA